MSILFPEGTEQQNSLCRLLIKILFQYTIYLLYVINPKEYSRFKLSLAQNDAISCGIPIRLLDVRCDEYFVI